MNRSCGNVREKLHREAGAILGLHRRLYPRPRPSPGRDRHAAPFQARPPCTRWSSRWSASATFAASQASRAASRCSSPPKTCPFSVTPNRSNPLCRGTSLGPPSGLAHRELGNEPGMNGEGNRGRKSFRLHPLPNVAPDRAAFPPDHASFHPPLTAHPSPLDAANASLLPALVRAMRRSTRRSVPVGGGTTTAGCACADCDTNEGAATPSAAIPNNPSRPRRVIVSQIRISLCWPAGQEHLIDRFTQYETLSRSLDLAPCHKPVSYVLSS